MKVAICSDIHVHRHDHADEILNLVGHINAQRGLDLLICAGDLSHRTSEVREFLASITVSCPRAWVPGNHDLWVIEAESEQDHAENRYRVALPGIAREVGWHYLPDGPLHLAGQSTSVVGTTAWFTGPGYSEWHDAQADARDELLATRMAAELESQLLSVDLARRVIVVTHHVPHHGCLGPDDTPDGRVNRHVTEVIRRHAARIDLVVHGHRHRRYDPKVIDGVSFVAHPFGMPGQHVGAEDGLRVIEVG